MKHFVSDNDLGYSEFVSFPKSKISSIKKTKKKPKVQKLDNYAKIIDE